MCIYTKIQFYIQKCEQKGEKTSLYYHHHKNKELEKEVIKIYALGPMLLTLPHCEWEARDSWVSFQVHDKQSTFCSHWWALVDASATISVVILKISDLNENVYRMKEFLSFSLYELLLNVEWYVYAQDHSKGRRRLC